MPEYIYECPSCGSTNIHQPDDPYDDYSEEWECRDCDEVFTFGDMKRID